LLCRDCSRYTFVCITLNQECSANDSRKPSSLYRGTNIRNHTTYTWLAQSNISSFDMDFSPLLQALMRNQHLPLDVQLGLVEFGSETFRSMENITFAAWNFSMDLQGDGKASRSAGSRLGVCWLLVWICTSFALLQFTTLSL
jgi:hypothetical protein